MELSKIDKRNAIVTNSAASASTSRMPKNLNEEQQIIYNELKSIETIPLGTVASPRFIVLNKVKFVVQVDSNERVIKQAQVFSIITGKNKGGVLEEAVIRDVLQNLKDYEWSVNKALFFFE